LTTRNTWNWRFKRHLLFPAFLDDYAFTAEGFIALYEATFSEQWLTDADALIEEVMVSFYDENDRTFYYTANDAELLIARKSEIMDNVIPSSSSTMVRVLYRLGEMLDNTRYTQVADGVFANVFPHIKQYGSAYSNWAIQLLELVYGNNEIAITGESAQRWRKELDKHYIPNKITMGGTKSNLPLLKDKAGMESKAYLCRNKTCSLPQDSIPALLQLLNDNRDPSQ
jgi:uncharacterized protein YyaL (SSP411 family)